MSDPLDDWLVWAAMKRFFKRLVGTGAIYLLGLGGLLAMGGLMAISSNAVIHPVFMEGGGKSGVPGGVVVESGNAAFLWFVAAALLVWLGVVVMRVPTRKKEESRFRRGLPRGSGLRRKRDG